MFDDDPFAAPAKKVVSFEAQLENASVEELEGRIEQLKAQIVACEQAIASKRAQRAAAESVFGAGPS